MCGASDGERRTATRSHRPSSPSLPQIRRFLLDCAIDLPHKAPTYATLAGLFNAASPATGAAIVGDASAYLSTAATTDDRDGVRVGARWLAALAAAGVATPASLGACLTALVEGADAARVAGEKAGVSPREWQPYADDLAAAALLALPWCGPDLAGSHELAGVVQGAGRYAASRPRTASPGLSPYLGPLPADDAAAACDSGGASFLGTLLDAITAAAESGDWATATVPTPAATLRATLAASTPHAATPPSVPADPPCLAAAGAASPDERAATLLAAHPPRGGAVLLPSPLPPLDAIIAADYVTDTVRTFDGDRIAAARTLALGLPCAAAAEAAREGGHAIILADTLISALLRPPLPALKPLAYAAIMVDVCKLVPAFPRAMSGCVRELFSRVEALDPELSARTADWLSYHLSNFEFMWPWPKWAGVLAAPTHDPARRFVGGLIARLVRLAYWQRIESVLPPEFRVLLPPTPDPAPLPAAGVGGGAASTPEDAAAAEIVALVRRKTPAAGLTEWVESSPTATALGGPSSPAVVSAVVRGLLTAGSKSFTHMITALERYVEAVGPLLDAAGGAGAAAALSAAATVWAAAPARAAQAIDRLMALRLVSGDAVVAWALASRGAASLEDAPALDIADAALHLAADKLAARSADAAADAAATRGAAVDAAEAADLADEAAAADAAGGRDDAAAPAAGPRAAAAAAEAAAEAKEIALEEALATQRGALLLAARTLVAVLAARTPTPDGDAAGAAWRAHTLMALRGFVRRHHGPYAAVADELRGVVGAEGVPADVRAAVEASLDL